MHYTYPHAQQICIGCMNPMPYEIVTPPPFLKLIVTCTTNECPFHGQRFEVLPTLLKPLAKEAKIELVTQ